VACETNRVAIVGDSGETSFDQVMTKDGVGSKEESIARARSHSRQFAKIPRLCIKDFSN
jgi:hypothetical protein